MRPALFTLVPVVATALLIAIGGERLARERIENRVPVDRDRLLDFSATLNVELNRLDALYQFHLETVAEGFGLEEESETYAREVEAIDAIHLFVQGRHRGETPLTPPGSRRPLPDLAFEDPKHPPFNPDNTTILPSRLVDENSEDRNGWLPAVRSSHRIYWTRPDQKRLVAFVINKRKLREVVNDYLAEWTESPLAPLREIGDQVTIRGSVDEIIASTTSEEQGPAALVTPFRNNLGNWRVQAWDRVTVTTTHNTSTLVAAGTIAAVLAIGGFLLYLQQRRALRLAEERVSFVNRVSHELGTPLTNITLNLDLATEAMESRPPEARRRLGIVTEEVGRLARLVANVLTFSRTERHTLEITPQPCTPDTVIDNTLKAFRPALLRREIEVEWTAQAKERVHLNPDSLGQIVGNLFSNVEKYAADGRWLGIESHLNGDTLTIRVSDHGPGISASHREKIFKPFERVNRKVNEGSSGTGLGLSIARDLAIRMGGTLELRDAKKGASFELRLPAPRVLAVVSQDEHSAA